MTEQEHVVMWHADGHHPMVEARFLTREAAEEFLREHTVDGTNISDDPSLGYYYIVEGDDA